MNPPQLTFCGVAARATFLTIIAVMIFSILALLVSHISPGRWPLREPSVSKPALSLTTWNTFTIAIFSDLHFGEEENGWGIDQDVNSTHVMTYIIKDESPDLVVLNGDLITGENTFRENSSAYVDQVVEPMLSTNTRWASIYGNHDSKFNLSREALFKVEKAYDLCYTHRMDGSLPGITNYYIPVHGTDDEPAAILWFFDSRGGNSYQHEPANVDDIPNWVAPETARWFTKTHEQLIKKHGRALPSVAFVHIPPHVFLQTQSAGLDAKNFPGLNEDVPVAIQGEGRQDDPFIDALLAAEGLHSVHVGHDHGNSWCAAWPGRAPLEAPFLCFAKHTGYGGYGSWRRGARVLKLSFSGGDGDDLMAVETWVRMEDGSIVTRVSLNETYGLDEYPPATGE